MARIRSGESGGIIVAKLNRAGRRVKHLLTDIAEIEEHGGVFISCHEKLDTSTPIGRFTLTIFAALAELELDERTAEWSGVHDRLIANGTHFAPLVPTGYLPVLNERGKRTGLALDPDRAPHVAEAFKMRARGESWRMIYRYLAEHVAKRHDRWTSAQADKRPRKPGTGKPKVHKGRPIRTQGENQSALLIGKCEAVPAFGSIAAVQDLIQNRVYVGEARYGRKIARVAAGAYPYIVSETEWQAANRAKPPRQPSRGGLEGYLLSGQLRCAECKGTLTADTNGHGLRVYRCKSNPSCTAKANISANLIEPYVEGQVFERVHEQGKVGAREVPNVKGLAIELAEATRQLEAWDDAFEAGDDPEAFQRGRAIRKARIEEAAARVGKARSDEASQETSLRTLTVWTQAPEGAEAFYRSHESVAERRKMLTAMLTAPIFVTKGRGSVQERVSIAG